MDTAELQRRIAELEAHNAKLQTKLLTKTRLMCKVGEKGGVSVYGLGRFPVTLYASQWARLFAFAGDVQGFIVEADKAGRLSHEKD